MIRLAYFGLGTVVQLNQSGVVLGVMNEERRSTPEIPRHVVNVDSRSDDSVERMLSNFADTPIVLDGKRYANVEAFWQAIKRPPDSPERALIARMSGREAKRAGEAIGGITFIEYGDEVIKYGSPEHHQLARRALIAKFDQSAAAREVLLSTGDSEITHVLYDAGGNQIPDSQSLPADVFTGFLIEIRQGYGTTE